MADTLWLKPSAPGLVVRDPGTKRVLAPDGSEVPNVAYWRRRIADGSAILLAEPPAGSVRRKDKDKDKERSSTRGKPSASDTKE